MRSKKGKRNNDSPLLSTCEAASPVPCPILVSPKGNRHWCNGVGPAKGHDAESTTHNKKWSLLDSKVIQLREDPTAALNYLLGEYKHYDRNSSWRWTVQRQESWLALKGILTRHKQKILQNERRVLLGWIIFILEINKISLGKALRNLHNLNRRLN